MHLSKVMQIPDNQIKTYSKSDTSEYLTFVQSAAPNSCEIKSIHPSLYGELLLSICSKPTDVESQLYDVVMKLLFRL